jgi:hypothetical protein
MRGDKDFLPQIGDRFKSSQLNLCYPLKKPHLQNDYLITLGAQFPKQKKFNPVKRPFIK